MVALLVVGTIIMCLLVDGIVLSFRERKVSAAGVQLTESPALVFAQDGGEKIEDKNHEEKQKPDEVNKTLS